MANTYQNVIAEQHVSLAIQQLLIGDYPQTWTPARIDVASPPSGFTFLGAVVEDTPALSATREKFILRTGIPRVRQYEAVVGLEASLEMQLHSYSWRHIQYSLGNLTYVSSATATGSIASITGINVVTMDSTTALESVAVGRQVVIAPVGLQDTPNATETVVASIHSDGLTIVLAPAPLTTPGAADLLYIYDYVYQAYGTTFIKNYTLLGVADFINGTQVVHRIAKCTPGEEMSEEIRSEQNPRAPLMFDAHGTTSGSYGNQDELIVMERFYFPKGV